MLDNWVKVDGWRVRERNTRQIWEVCLYRWRHNSRAWLVIATEQKTGATVVRDSMRDCGQRAAISGALDLTATLGGKREDGSWVVYCDRDIPGWVCLPIKPNKPVKTV